MPLIRAAIMIVALTLSYPWEMLTLLTIAYLAALPWGRSYYYRLAARHAGKAGDSPKG